MTSHKNTKRRTFAEIARLSHNEVKAELLAVGLKPLELVTYVPHYGDGPDTRPRLEAHQRYDYTEHDRLYYADDPFEHAYQAQQRKKEPSPYDALNSDYFWLYGYELNRYVEGLSLSTIQKKLETFGKDTGRTPQRTWGEQDYRKEMASRVSNADHEAFVASYVSGHKKVGKKT